MAEVGVSIRSSTVLLIRSNCLSQCLANNRRQITAGVTAAVNWLFDCSKGFPNLTVGVQPSDCSSSSLIVETSNTKVQISRGLPKQMNVDANVGYDLQAQAQSLEKLTRLHPECIAKAITMLKQANAHSIVG